ncbi:MAG: hypothetical protein ACOZIN_21335, partial [Myxococcota bacterium]
MRYALLLILFYVPAAWGWESTCYTYADPAQEVGALGAASSYCQPEAGPYTARQRWVGGLDEHRQLWEQTRVLAGLPDAASSTRRLRVFTSSATVAIAGASPTSLIPVAFEQSERAQTRAFSVGELAQLPDFSYALWDWASAHETCPLDGAGVGPDECHDFASHMGPVNSNHFLPQAQRFYAHYHAMAVARAAECRSMRDALTATPRFLAYVEDCTVEALALEAVGQHYLQDAWSMGHMWQRWGSPNLTDFPGSGDDQRDRAVLVALTAGLIHGARGVLQRLPAWTSYDVNDAMCAPHADVEYVAPGGGTHAAIGDDYLRELPPFGTSSSLSEQSTRLFSCAASGMREVYLAAGEPVGALGPLDGGLAAVDPTGAECFGQRATNKALLAGMAVQLKVAGQQVMLELSSKTIGWMVPKVARSTGEVPVPAKLRNQFRFELQRVVSMTRLYAKQNPGGTEMAEGRMGDFLGAKPNGQHNGLASYVDPSLPWPATTDSAPQARERAEHLARLFHRGHAADWCKETTAAT